MKQLCFVFLLLLPVLAIMATTIEVSAPLPVPVFDSVRNSFELSGYGSTTAPGSWQLPVKTMNILLPPGASVSSYHVELLSPTTIPAPEPRRNGRFHSSEGSLGSSASASPGISYIYRGTQAWGDLSFARFDLLPASYDASASAYLWHREAKITLDYDITTPRARNIIPQTLSEPGFFANPEVLPRWYRNTSQRNYDYLIVSTPSLFAAASELDTFRQGQGLITQFADISTILATSPGSNNAAKLRNYLISEYNTSPFTYLLLIGDIDVIPIAQLTPEPNGSETIPSDFYFSDLSSNFDSDNDGRLGEYSTGHGDQDWEVDFTPEVFVGRIAWSTPATVSTICQRIVNFEQSSAPWKNHALLPAAFLNYHQEEWNMEFAETDGAGFMELIRSTIIRDMQTTTLYEQLGVVPSFPSDHALDYDTLKNLISNNSYGLLSWSAHGSATSSSRKVWMEDTDSNGIPDSWEMQWLGMVNRESFNNLANTDGMVVFCASCYNGKIDHSSASLAETVLQKKGVAVIGATRTGWYKIGWQNPGWGGLSSYNYHFLENYITHGMSAGAAQSYANLLHTQYYLFGDPIDSDGIIWPELQNVYTYLMFGDPAVGHTPANPQPQGEILVWEPTYQNGLAIVNAINDLGYYNVVYTDKLIPDYEYLHHFEAVFALFGFGALAYYLEPNSLEYNLLNGYLDSGGKLYVEGLINWDDTDPFWQKFGTIAPYDNIVNIAGIVFNNGDMDLTWSYEDAANTTQALSPIGETAIPIFYNYSEGFATDLLGVFNTNGNYRTIASSFQLHGVTEPVFSLVDMMAVIFDTLNVGITDPVSVQDHHVPMPNISLAAYPNPFGKSLNIEVKGSGTVELAIYNLRGQQVHQDRFVQHTEKSIRTWMGTDANGKRLPSGIYFVRLNQGSRSITKKVMLIR